MTSAESARTREGAGRVVPAHQMESLPSGTQVPNAGRPSVRPARPDYASPARGVTVSASSRKPTALPLVLCRMLAQPAGVAGAQGPSTGWTVSPPARWYIRATLTSTPTDPSGDQEHGPRRDVGQHPDQRARGLHARGCRGPTARRARSPRGRARPCSRSGSSRPRVRRRRRRRPRGGGRGRPPRAGPRRRATRRSRRSAQGRRRGAIQVVQGHVQPGLRVVAEGIGVALALAVAGVVEREHSVAAAREHPDVAGDAAAAAAGAVAHQHGRPVARGARTRPTAAGRRPS